jgi:hypothetical protein
MRADYDKLCKGVPSFSAIAFEEFQARLRTAWRGVTRRAQWAMLMVINRNFGVNIHSEHTTVRAQRDG